MRWASKKYFFIATFFALLAMSSRSFAEISSDITVGHRADFLTNPACPWGTTGYINATTVQRETCRAGIIDRSYTHIYVSVTSQTKDFYADMTTFKARLQELRSAGLEIVLFLTSDTGGWKDKSLSEIKTDISRAIPLIDSMISSYALGIEIDEYWTLSEAQSIGEHLQTLTNKKIAAHQLPGKWSYCKSYSWCDYMILQYGFGKTAADIAQLTKSAIADLKKSVVAGEYNLNSYGSEGLSIQLGNAAVVAGAVGFGNGGGGKVTEPTAAPVKIDFVSSGKTYDISVAEVSNSIVYIDRPYTLLELSPALDGLTLVRTANDDKSLSNTIFLKLTVSYDSTIYVAYSAAATALPEWLSSWHLTDLVFKTTDSVMRVYKRVYAAGQISLGANRALPSAGPDGLSNYLVLVDPGSSSQRLILSPKNLQIR